MKEKSSVVLESYPEGSFARFFFWGKSEACFCLEGFKIDEMGPPYDSLVPVPSSLAMRCVNLA